MEELLKKFIVNEYKEENIDILFYEVDGATCFVSFKIQGCRETKDINIWDMLIFLNSNK